MKEKFEEKFKHYFKNRPDDILEWLKEEEETIKKDFAKKLLFDWQTLRKDYSLSNEEVINWMVFKLRK